MPPKTKQPSSKPQTTSSPRNRQQRQGNTTTHRTRPTKKSTTLFSVFRRPQMPSVFNIVRACIYATVLLWTIICLAIAIHFNEILTSNDLTRFIPFSIFVCSATLAIFPALLLFGIKKVNPITTRIELGCLGLAGIIWLALAAFLVSSDIDTADVECYSSDAPDTPVEIPDFSTDLFQAQYRVLEAFSLFNVILIWGFLLFLLFLALRHHTRGERDVWLTPVTSYSWFYRYQSEDNQKLPPPVTAPVDRSKSKGAGALTEVPEKASERRARMAQQQQRQKQNSKDQPNYGYKHGYWLPQGGPPVPPKATGEASRTRATRSTRDRHDRTGDKFHRDASPRR